jgi:Glutamine synthetase, catalytic domain
MNAAPPTRVVPGFEAPVNLVYSQRNRSACVPIPITGSNPKTKRIEFRVPDPRPRRRSAGSVPSSTRARSFSTI